MTPRRKYFRGQWMTLEEVRAISRAQSIARTMRQSTAKKRKKRRQQKPELVTPFWTW